MSKDNKIVEGLREAVAHAKGEDNECRVSVVHVPNTPASRPDLWNKGADSEALGQNYLRAISLLTGRGVVAKSEVAIVIALHAQRIEVLEARQVKLEAVVEAARLVAEGTAVEIGSTPLRMRNLRNKLADLGDGDE